MSNPKSDVKATAWQQGRDGRWYISGHDCEIALEAQAKDCARGNWIAKVSTDIYPPAFDEQEGWPRYYFDLEGAKAECEAWLKKREELA